MKKLFIDLGHSKRFPGAIGFKRETDWNRAIWACLYPLLNKNKWDVVLVPTDFLTDWSSNRQLINRINWINKRGKASDYLLSIHGNAASNPNVRGVTTCHMGGSEPARLASTALSKKYAQSTSIPLFGSGAFDDRTGRFGRIGMVRDTVPFALLIEAGFVTNKEDMRVTPAAAANGIADYFNSL